MKICFAARAKCHSYEIEVLILCLLPLGGIMYRKQARQRVMRVMRKMLHAVQVQEQRVLAVRNLDDEVIQLLGCQLGILQFNCYHWDGITGMEPPPEVGNLVRRVVNAGDEHACNTCIACGCCGCSVGKILCNGE